VRIATVLLTTVLAAVTSGLAAQAPEVFTATAQIKNATGAMSGPLEVRITRYTPDFDRTAMETALRQGGYPAFLNALRNAPVSGQVVLAGGEPHTVRYARERTEAGRRTIVLVTDKPIIFIGGAQSDSRSRVGFELALIYIQLDATGPGRGTMAAAARVRPDGTGGVILDDYAEQLITLSGVARKPS
jgi:hypothetical protein